jgi:hypothetical protein
VRRSILLLPVLVALASACLANVPGYAAARTVPAPRVVTAHGPAYPGEVVQVRGTLKPATRKVVLQRWLLGGWRPMKQARTGKGGAYSLAVRATTRPETYRVYAPKARVHHKRYKAAASRTVVVRAAAAKASVAFTGAPIGQPFTSTAVNAGNRLYPVSARTSPARSGAAVTLQRQDAGGWTTVATGRTDGYGQYTARLAMDPTAARTYRAVVAPGNGASTLVSPAATATFQREVWADDFTTDSLAEGPGKKWQYREQKATGLRKCAYTAKDRARVPADSGYLELTAARVQGPTTKGPAGLECKHGVFENSALYAVDGSGRRFETGYGTFAARIKFQSGRGQHGAFWLQSPDDLTGSSEPAGSGTEIDAAEYYGDGRPDGGLSNLVHYTPPKGALSSSGGVQASARALFGGTRVSSGYHVYSVEWTPTAYVFRTDGVVTFQTARPHLWKGPEYPVLSLLTSDWEVPAYTAGTPMQVDWVRVWQ